MRSLLFLTLFFLPQARALDVVTAAGVRKIDETVYRQTLTHLKDGIEDQIIRDLSATTPTPSPKGLKLKKISVGLEVSGDVALGPWGLGTSLKQRFVFERLR